MMYNEYLSVTNVKNEIKKECKIMDNNDKRVLAIIDSYFGLNIAKYKKEIMEEIKAYSFCNAYHVVKECFK